MIAKLRLWSTYFKQALSSILYNRLIYAISVGTIAISPAHLRRLCSSLGERENVDSRVGADAFHLGVSQGRHR